MSTPIQVFPGERFNLALQIRDQNNNSKIGIYTYPSNEHFTKVDVTEIDLTDSETDKSFAFVNRKYQRTSLVLRNSSRNFTYTQCLHHKDNTVDERQFILHLIDSSNGNVV